MTDTITPATSSDDLVDELRSWLEENWDPEITVAEWWERLGLAGWAAPLLPEQCYGRGLRVVARLADGWGGEPRTVGKTVFAELALRNPDMAVGPRVLHASPPRTRTAGAVTPR